MEMQAAAMRAKATVADQSTAQPSPRLISAAHEFEGQMLKELLKPMTASDGLGGSDQGSQVLSEFSSEALGKALSEQGGFGIAKQIIAQLSRSGNRSDTESVTTNGHLNTSMSRLK